MPFDADPFAQARLEVDNKRMGAQVKNSRFFHSFRSAVSSSGSAASKGAGLALGAGKLFLSLIPVPVVASVVGAVADAIDGVVRGKLHARKLTGTVSDENLAKFSIKELTVENLDRYRWKVADAYKELNTGVTEYNASAQTCDDMYKVAMLVGQVERRKLRLNEELAKFTAALNAVNAWTASLDAAQGSSVSTLVTAIGDNTRTKARLFTALVREEDIKAAVGAHAGCEQWCYVKKTADYDPSRDSLAFIKKHAHEVVSFVAPIAVAAIAVKGSDYRHDSDNSSMR